MTIASVPIHHVKFDGVVRLKPLLFRAGRSLQTAIVHKQNSAPIAGPGRIMAVAVIGKRLNIRPIRIHRVNVRHRPGRRVIRCVCKKNLLRRNRGKKDRDNEKG